MLVKIDRQVFQTDCIMTMSEFNQVPKQVRIFLAEPGGSSSEVTLNRSLDYVVNVMNQAAHRLHLDKVVNSSVANVYGDLTVQDS